MKFPARLLTIVAFTISLGWAAIDDLGGARWKEELAKGNSPYHKVQMSDYKVVKDINGHSDMRTWGFIHYSYRNHFLTEGKLVTAKIYAWSIRSGLDGQKSLRRAGYTDETLLVHEQHHLDINEIFADKFRKLPVPVGYGPDTKLASADLKQKVEKELHDCLKEAQEMQELYDQDTQHSRNRHGQEVWNRKIERMLKDAGIKFDVPKH